MKFVIVGLGSIGKRHQKNLKTLGHKTISVHRYDDLSQSLKKHNPDGVFICNPTSMHLETSLVVAKAGMNFFLEKPISNSLFKVDELIKIIKEKNLVVQVGYQFRYEPELIKLKQKLKQVGQIKKAKIICSSFLPDWRPEIDYRQNYAAKKELGGGVLLDLSHEIDYAVWLFGIVEKVSAKVKKSDKLDIETEAIADLELTHQSGVKSYIHLDYVTKGYIRNCQIFGESGQLSWDFAEIKNTGWNINQMYIDEAKNFIDSINGIKKPKPTIQEGKQVLEIVEAAKKASKSKKIIKL